MHIKSLRKHCQTTPPQPRLPTEDEIMEMREIIRKEENAFAALALLRDKRILFSPTRKSFIMYGVVKRLWVSMGDPVGVPEEFAELIQNFRLLCEDYGGRAVFYQVSEERRIFFAEAGFSFFKLGEEGIVPLKTFTLEGSDQREFRHILRKVEKLGYDFGIIEPEALPPQLSRLREISEAWLQSKSGKEKGFSIGMFDESYLRNFPVAVVQDSEGEVIAFANVLKGNGLKEFSIDLMRHIPDSPNGVMDYLFLSLFQWGHDQGYGEMSLGVAPLSGLEYHPLSSVWTLLGVWVFRHGEHFYNFQGLREYKDKFHPQWRARYLASVNQHQIPQELLGIKRLISGGLRQKPHTSC